ncbi:MAG: response regulator [Alphaproteobacteria bacterium]|nr:response regulator [Alphaproteobacteria bacterium]
MMQMHSIAEKPHILVVDDDARISSLVCRYLDEHDFVTMSAGNGAEAREIMQAFAFDAAVVDVMMPGETGLELTGFIRENIKIPVILLTALGEVEDRIGGFEAGADDYLPKPFEPMELVMRLKAVLRRSGFGKAGQEALKIGRWEFNETRAALVDGDEFVKLSGVEVNLIKALARTPGQPVSREDLARLCNIDTAERSIDVQITRLRKKIESDTKTPRHLQTVRGKGYVLHTGAA